MYKRKNKTIIIIIINSQKKTVTTNMWSKVWNCDILQKNMPYTLSGPFT